MKTSMMAMTSADILHFPKTEPLPADIENFVADITESLGRMLESLPYQELIHRVSGREATASSGLSSAEPISVIPGKQKAFCTTYTLAFAAEAASKRPYGFSNVMREVRATLIDCERITRAVVLLTDVWSPRLIDEHLRDIRAHERQGRFVVPHLVTGQHIVRLNWPRG